MTPQFHPSLVNSPFDDPVVYVDFLDELRALPISEKRPVHYLCDKTCEGKIP